MTVISRKSVPALSGFYDTFPERKISFLSPRPWRQKESALLKSDKSSRKCLTPKAALFWTKGIKNEILIQCNLRLICPTMETPIRCQWKGARGECRPKNLSSSHSFQVLTKMSETFVPLYRLNNEILSHEFSDTRSRGHLLNCLVQVGLDKMFN